MENNFIQMAVTIGHAVVATIGPICKLIIDCVPVDSRILSFKASIVSRLVDGILIFDGTTTQIIAQRCQIAAPIWPNDFNPTADNAIFKNTPQNIQYICGFTTRSAVLLKANFANILPFNFCKQKFCSTWPDNDRH